MNQKKLKKGSDKLIGGVCSGVAEYFGWDITIVRVIWAILAGTATGFGWLYLILLLVMPSY